MTDGGAGGLDDVTSDIAIVATGCNIGHRGRALALLRDLLQRDGVVIDSASSEVLTRPVGVTGQADFHNQVLRLRSPTPWTPRRWHEHTRSAELDAGRRDTYHWGPRRADVDILLLGADGRIEVHTSGLVVPHQQIRNRAFLGRLLAEIDAC